MSSVFEKKLAEYKRRQAEEAEANKHPEDVIPAIPRQIKPEDQQLEAILGALTIDRAYERWCNKSPVPRRNQVEGLKVSCPNPAHPDHRPSAWLNTDKGLWNCPGCEIGGDMYDIAAWKFGYSVPGYKQTHFRELREKMAGDLGYTKRSSGGVTYYSSDTVASSDFVDDHEAPIPAKRDISPPETGTSTPNPDKVVVDGYRGSDSEPPLATVTPIRGDEDADDIDDYPFPPIDWKSIVPKDTFLWKWMEITTKDDVPEEYHFWNGLVAIGMALGRDVTLYDRIPVYGNLFLCTVGHSGDGKSQARGHLNEILHRTLPYKHSDANSKGVRRIATPGSAEVLIHQFSKPVVDPVDPKKVAYFAAVRGIVDFNELSALSGRSGRTGNVIKPVLMQFYDNDKYISTSSMMHGVKEAHDAYACVTTTTQPRAFRDLMHKSDIDSGFLNRWLFVGGVPKTRTAIGGVMIDTHPCDKYLTEIAAWAGKGRMLTWDEDAALAFTEFYHKILEPSKRNDETGLLVRIDLSLKKLALLLTANSRLNSVPLSVVQSLVVLYKYLVECYGLSSDAIGNTLHSEIRGEILRHIKRISANNGGKGCSQRELGLRLNKKKYPMEQVVKVLKFMTELGELEQITTPAGTVGRPTVRYQSVD